MSFDLHESKIATIYIHCSHQTNFLEPVSIAMRAEKKQPIEKTQRKRFEPDQSGVSNPCRKNGESALQKVTMKLQDWCESILLLSKNSYNSQTIVFVVDFNFNVIYSERCAYSVAWCFSLVSFFFAVSSVCLMLFRILWVWFVSCRQFIKDSK